MESIEDTLTPEERRAAEAIFARLAPADAANVRMITKVVDGVAQQYAAELRERGSVRIKFCAAWGIGQDIQETADAYPFFAVYAIGSLLHKPSPRDTDLLVATNAWWMSLPRSYD